MVNETDLRVVQLIVVYETARSRDGLFCKCLGDIVYRSCSSRSRNKNHGGTAVGDGV